MLSKEIQHAMMFRVSYPSRANHLRDDLNEESVISLGITISDTLIQMLTKKYIIIHFIHGMYKEYT